MSVKIPEGWALVVPEHPDAIPGTARKLIQLADSPADVLTQRGGREFLVPESVADRFSKSQTRPRRTTKKESNDG